MGADHSPDRPTQFSKDEPNAGRPFRSEETRLGTSWIVTACMLLALAGTSSAQSVLTLGSGSGLGGTAVNIPLSLNSIIGAEPAALQWNLNYPAAAITNVTATASPAVAAAGKSVVCAGTSCLIYGLNAAPIPNGIVATLTIQLVSSASGSLPLQLSNTSAASVLGDSLAVSSSDGTILAHPAPTGAIAHIAAGGTLTSGIFVLNTTGTTAAYSVQFFDDNGTALPLPFATGLTSVLNGTLAPHGSAYIETTGSQPTTLAGWGQITADKGVVIQALFRNLAGGTYYEAAVPSTTVSSTQGSKQILFPYDNTTFAATGQPFVTGVAIANFDGTPANVFCTAYGADGTIVPNAFPVPTLPPLGHWASFDFSRLVGLRGTIQCTSNANLSATALRFLGNEISSLPVVTNPAPSGGPTQTGAIAEVAAGGTLTTGIFVLNGGAGPATYSLNFYGDDGQPLPAPFSTISDMLKPQGAAYIEETSPQQSSIVGWAKITADSSVVVQTLFRNAVNGTYYEAAIPSTPGSKEFLIPFDSTTFAGNGQAFVTGIAIANLDATAATIVCTAYDPTGNTIPSAVIVPALPPLGHWSAYQFPLLTGRGTVDCVSNTNVSATALRFLGGAFSSLPVVTLPIVTP